MTFSLFSQQFPSASAFNNKILFTNESSNLISNSSNTSSSSLKETDKKKVLITELIDSSDSDTLELILAIDKEIENFNDTIYSSLSSEAKRFNLTEVVKNEKIVSTIFNETTTAEFAENFFFQLPQRKVLSMIEFGQLQQATSGTLTASAIYSRSSPKPTINSITISTNTYSTTAYPTIAYPITTTLLTTVTPSSNASSNKTIKSFERNSIEKLFVDPKPNLTDVIELDNSNCKKFFSVIETLFLL